MDSVLKKEFQYYLDHQAELAARFLGKVIVIKDGVVIGSYDTQLAAVTEVRKTHAMGSFLVQPVSLDNSGYTQTFHSRVSFN